jgi:hypothetical protein
MTSSSVIVLFILPRLSWILAIGIGVLCVGLGTELSKRASINATIKFLRSSKLTGRLTEPPPLIYIGSI